MADVVRTERGLWPAIRNRTTLFRLGAAFALFVVALVIYRVVWNAPPVDQGVITEWNDTILRLGIEPVFPPEEDIYVGDVRRDYCGPQTVEQGDAPTTAA